jgi:hypothetical protein
MYIYTIYIEVITQYITFLQKNKVYSKVFQISTFSSIMKGWGINTDILCHLLQIQYAIY